MGKIIKTIIRDFKTPPVAVRPVTIQPKRVTHYQSRAETKKVIEAGLATQD